MRTATLLLLVACHTTSQKAVRLDVDEKKSTNIQETGTVAAWEERTKEPDKVKTHREQDAVVVQAPDGTIQVARVTAKPLVLAKGSKVIGTVATSSTDVDHESGKVVDTKTNNSNSAKVTKEDAGKTTHLEGSDDETKDVGPNWKFYGFLALAIVILLGAGYCYLKFIKKVVWL